jgi:hypothetical protein
MKRALAIGLMSWQAIAIAAEKDCTAIGDDKDRLACYDKNSGVTPKAADERTRPPVWAQRISVRNKGTLNNLGKDPAAFAFTRKDGEEAMQAQAALVVLGPAAESGWQSFAAAAINRDTLAKTKTDVRTVSGGVSGTLINYLDHGFALWPTLSVSQQTDLQAKTESTLGTIDTYVPIKGLADGIPFESGSNEFRLFPRFGYQFEDRHRVKEGDVAGSLQGYYGGIRFEFWPGKFSSRIQLTALGQIYRDSWVDEGLSKRTLRYSKLSIDYYFYDPNDKDAWFTPILGIEREVGDDPVFGVVGANRTQLSFKIKIN